MHLEHLLSEPVTQVVGSWQPATSGQATEKMSRVKKKKTHPHTHPSFFGSQLAFCSIQDYMKSTYYFGQYYNLP